MKQINVCPVCGGKLEKKDKEFVCLYCNGVFSNQTVEEIEEKVNSMLDEFKKELVANTRTQLWDAIHEKYLSSERILSLSRNIKTYLPDDFLANFFEFVNTKSHTQEQINEYINNIDYEEYYYLIDVVLDFMIKSLEPSNLLSLNNLIENTYKQKYLKLYNEYTSRLAKEAERVKSGVYDLTVERDVFVAYSSKDIQHVEEVVRLLNKEGISYFVALENLRHGKGAVENYDKALEQAIENCKTFLFISSTNSRTRECDALKKEIPHLKKVDKLNAPAEYRNDYSKMPRKYKKPRVQLLIGEPPVGTLGDKQVAEIFDGYEWRYDAESAVEAIYNFLNDDYFEEETEAERIKRELEEKQAQQIEELKKMMAEMQANLNASKEQSAPEKKVEDNKVKTTVNVAETSKPAEANTKQNSYFDNIFSSIMNGWKDNDTPISEVLGKSNNSATKETESNIKKKRKQLMLGSYYINDDKTKEPLLWDILEEKDGKALIISQKIIYAKNYGSGTSKYDSSLVRNWINNDFYNVAFSENEKKRILITSVDNSASSTGETSNAFACNNTTDKMFLLSVSEVGTYYIGDRDRKAEGTPYAIQHGLYEPKVLDDKSSVWWLRSPFPFSTYAYQINSSGMIVNSHISSQSCGIRPACWVILDNAEPKKQAKSSVDKPYKRDGKKVTFGHWIKTLDFKETPIEWDIIAENNGYALLLSRYVLEEMDYDKLKPMDSSVGTKMVSRNYKECGIRNYLNDGFYNKAFNSDEKNIIPRVKVVNNKESVCNPANINFCEDTNDQIFLLSAKEVFDLLKDENLRIGIGTEIKKNEKQTWWLRSVYGDSTGFAYGVVTTEGKVQYIKASGLIVETNGFLGRTFFRKNYGIRPACWIKL